MKLKTTLDEKKRIAAQFRASGMTKEEFCASYGMSRRQLTYILYYIGAQTNGAAIRIDPSEL